MLHKPILARIPPPLPHTHTHHHHHHSSSSSHQPLPFRLCSLLSSSVCQKGTPVSEARLPSSRTPLYESQPPSYPKAPCSLPSIHGSNHGNHRYFHPVHRRVPAVRGAREVSSSSSRNVTSCLSCRFVPHPRNNLASYYFWLAS